jgi:hypothetical protein
MKAETLAPGAKGSSFIDLAVEIQNYSGFDNNLSTKPNH